MAILQLENGTTYTNFRDIVEELAPVNIQISRCPVRQNLDLSRLLAHDILSLTEKDRILQAVSNHFLAVKRRAGYRWRELMVLHPGSPHLYALLAHCDRCHTHTDSEALYILAGEGIFGFVRPDGSQVELIVQPEEYIRVPAGIEHWFSPTPSLQIKAVRYFTSVEGWVPQYTNTAICFRQAVARGYSE